MKKFMALVLAVVIIAMASSFVGVVFANMVLAKNNEHSTQLVVVEATATPSATVEPTAEATVTVEPTATPIAEPTATATVEPTATPIVEATATPIVEAIRKDPSQISLGNFLTMSRSSDGSFNATPVGSQNGWVEFTDKDLMSHVGEQITVNVASQSLSVKLENKSHIYRRADVGQADFSVCPQHRALYRRHTSAYGDDIVITLSAEDITNIARYAAYWYNSDGELTYGLTICDCLVGKHSYTSSNGSNSNSGGDYDHPSDEPTNSNTPQPPKDEATNNQNHNDQPQEPQPATKNTPAAPAQDYVGSNQHAHNEQPKTTDGAQVDDASGNPNHSDLVVEEADVAYTPAEDLGGAVPPAPAENMVASIPSAPAEDFVASISSDTEAEENVVTDVEIAMNVPSFSDMPTE